MANQICPLLRRYYADTAGIIFVVDSADQTAFGDSRDELARLLQEDSLKDAAVLIIANKQDKENAMDPAKMKSQLDDAALTHRSWDVLACNSVTGEGLAECLKWMSDRI